MNEELLFSLCDIKRQVETMLTDADKDITSRMNEDNRRGYDFGTLTVLNILENVLTIGEDEDHVIVNKTGLDKNLNYEECDLHDLLEKFDSRAIATR
jgi:hypothetical protein